MARRQHRTRSATLGAQVAVAALRRDRPLAELAETFEIHPNQIAHEKDQLVERRCELFGKTADGNPAPGTVKLEAKTFGSLWRMIFQKVRSLKRDC